MLTKFFQHSPFLTSSHVAIYSFTIPIVIYIDFGFTCMQIVFAFIQLLYSFIFLHLPVHAIHLSGFACSFLL